MSEPIEGQPTFMTGDFHLAGWHFERFEPANDSEPNEVHIVGTKDDRREVEVVQLVHTNIFGLDVEDADAVNEAVERLLQRLEINDE